MMLRKFQVGDYCAWNNDLGNASGHDNWIVCQIIQVGQAAMSGTTIYRLKSIDDSKSDFWVKCDDIRTAPGFCLVCKKNVGLEANKLKPHNKGHALCYGSYMPGL